MTVEPILQIRPKRILPFHYVYWLIGGLTIVVPLWSLVQNGAGPDGFRNIIIIILFGIGLIAFANIYLTYPRVTLLKDKYEVQVSFLERIAPSIAGIRRIAIEQGLASRKHWGLFYLLRPYRRLTVYFRDKNGNDNFVDIFIDVFHKRDLEQLLEILRTLRPDLQVPVELNT
jgi:hypothetical protein